MRYECCTCKCLRPYSKRHKLLRKGRHDLGAETDIVNLLKQLRAIWTILDLKLQLSPKQIAKVKESQRRTIFDQDDTQDDQANVMQRKMTLRHYDPNKIHAEEEPKKEKHAILKTGRERQQSIKSIQRDLVEDSGDEQENIDFHPGVGND